VAAIVTGGGPSLTVVPVTQLGRIALGLGIASIALIGLVVLLPLGLLALLVSVLAGTVSLLAIALKGERGVLAFALLALPLLVAFLLTLAGA